MNSDHDKSSLLAPLKDAYEPAEGDADRVFAKISAALAAPVATGAEPPAPPQDPPAPAAKPTSYGLVAAASAVVLAGAIALLASRGGDAPASSTPHTPQAHGAVAPAPVTTDVAPPPAPAVLPSVSVDSLPSANVAVKTGSIAAPPAPVASAAPAASAAPTAAPEAPASETLDKEARLLAESRRASQRGDGAAALAVLDEHARTFPNGFLAAERDAERVIVLCSLGRRDQAVREGQTFIASHPAGPLTRRVTLSCAGEQ